MICGKHCRETIGRGCDIDNKIKDEAENVALLRAACSGVQSDYYLSLSALFGSGFFIFSFHFKSR